MHAALYGVVIRLASMGPYWRGVLGNLSVLPLCSSMQPAMGLGTISTQENRLKKLHHDFYLDSSFHSFQKVDLYWYIYLREADISTLPSFAPSQIQKVYFLLRKVYTVVNFGHVEQWIEIPHRASVYSWTVPPVESAQYFVSFLVFFKTAETEGKSREGHSVLVHSNTFTIKGFSFFLSLDEDLIWRADQPVGLRISSHYPVPKDIGFYLQLRKVDNFVSHSAIGSDNNAIKTAKLDFDGQRDTLIYFAAPEDFCNRRAYGSLYNFVIVNSEWVDAEDKYYYRVNAYSVPFRMQASAPPFIVKEPFWAVPHDPFQWGTNAFRLGERILFKMQPPDEMAAQINSTVVLLRNCRTPVISQGFDLSMELGHLIISEERAVFSPITFAFSFAHPGVYCWAFHYGHGNQTQIKSGPFSVRGHPIDHIHDNTVWHPGGKNGFSIRFEPSMNVTKFRMEVLHDRLLVDTDNVPFAEVSSALICAAEYVFEKPYLLPNRSIVYFNALMGPTFNRHMFWKYGYYIRLYVTEQYAKLNGSFGYFTFPLAESERFAIYPDHDVKKMDPLHLLEAESMDPIIGHQKVESSGHVAVTDTRLAVFYPIVTAIVALAD